MPPYGIEWLDEAAADVRTIDRSMAMRIFDGILHFARTGSGDIKTLHGDMTGSLRLRVGQDRKPIANQTACAIQPARRTIVRRETQVARRFHTGQYCGAPTR